MAILEKHKIFENDTSEEIKEPNLYDVFILNDDYTSQDFVVDILVNVFNKEEMIAIQLMLSIHHDGSAKIATYPYDIAKTKIKRVEELAFAEEFPLKCIMEKA